MAASAYFLPKYDARAATALVAALRERCAAAEAASAPRRKFAFAARKAAPAAPAAPAAEVEPPPAAGASSMALALRFKRAAADALSEAAVAPLQPPAGAGLRSCRGGAHVLRRAQLGPPDADFTLEDLEGAPYSRCAPIIIINPWFAE